MVFDLHLPQFNIVPQKRPQHEMTLWTRPGELAIAWPRGARVPDKVRSDGKTFDAVTSMDEAYIGKFAKELTRNGVPLVIIPNATPSDHGVRSIRTVLSIEA